MTLRMWKSHPALYSASRDYEGISLPAYSCQPLARNAQAGHSPQP